MLAQSVKENFIKLGSSVVRSRTCSEVQRVKSLHVGKTPSIRTFRLENSTLLPMNSTNCFFKNWTFVSVLWVTTAVPSTEMLQIFVLI